MRTYALYYTVYLCMQHSNIPPFECQYVGIYCYYRCYSSASAMTTAIETDFQLSLSTTSPSIRMDAHIPKRVPILIFLEGVGGASSSSSGNCWHKSIYKMKD